MIKAVSIEDGLMINNLLTLIPKMYRDNITLNFCASVLLEKRKVFKNYSNSVKEVILKYFDQFLQEIDSSTLKQNDKEIFYLCSSEIHRLKQNYEQCIEVLMKL